DGSGSTSPPQSSRPASNESPAHTSSPKTSKPKLHNAWKGQHYDATVPTVADRIAQTVVARRLEAKVEPIFHPDSYGYRPGRSPRDAVAACRQRCWKTNGVIDLDIQKFFDSVPWDLVVKAVEVNTDDRWVVLYVQRWLQAPVQLPNGALQKRDRGTPQ